MTMNRRMPFGQKCLRRVLDVFSIWLIVMILLWLVNALTDLIWGRPLLAGVLVLSWTGVVALPPLAFGVFVLLTLHTCFVLGSLLALGSVACIVWKPIGAFPSIVAGALGLVFAVALLLKGSRRFETLLRK